MKFNQIIEKLNSLITDHSLNYNPDFNPELKGITPIEEAQTETISYIEGDKFANKVTDTIATALILPNNKQLQEQVTQRGIAWLSTPNPRLVFAQTISLFYQPFRPQPSIHPSAVIDPSVILGNEVYIGANAVIEKDVILGDRSCIMPNVVIYPEVKIGKNTLLHSNCTIHERSQIGNNCVIHSGAVIGAEGFGFVPTPQGWYKMEQSGYVILEDGVEIGCNSAVDRPSVGITRIGKNTKLDNLVHIAHSCQIGENCAMAAQVGIAGGVTVGNNVILAGQVGIANQAIIGDGAIASAKAGIHSNVASGEVVSGYPAVPHSIYLKASAVYKRLPEMYQSIKKLTKLL
jgi:UDP-3-O-[3-hydroxymyristoyl] glucosamine N-acyltransferase